MEPISGYSALEFQKYWADHGRPRPHRHRSVHRFVPDEIVEILLQRHINLIDSSKKLHFTDPELLDTAIFLRATDRRPVGDRCRTIAGHPVDRRSDPRQRLRHLLARLEGRLSPRIYAASRRQSAMMPLPHSNPRRRADEHLRRHDDRHLPHLPASPAALGNSWNSCFSARGHQGPPCHGR